MKKAPSEASLEQLEAQHDFGALLGLVNDPLAKTRLTAVLNVVHFEWARFNDIFLINQRRNFTTKTIQMVSAALVPVVATLPQLHDMVTSTKGLAWPTWLAYFTPHITNVLAAIFGAIAAICGVFDATWHAHDMVVRSLATRDRLSLELLRFEGGVGDYGASDDAKKVAAFTARIAAILDRELSEFSATEQGKPPQPSGNQGGDGNDAQGGGHAGVSGVPPAVPGGASGTTTMEQLATSQPAPESATPVAKESTSSSEIR
jgi:hypothetical protein